MSTNLRRATYRFFNKSLSKEEYKKALQNVDTGSYENIQKYTEEFVSLYNRSIHRFAQTKNVVNSTGHVFSNAKNCHYIFNGADLENCRYCLYVNDARDCVDINNAGHNSELNYEVCTVGVNSFGNMFSVDVWPETQEIIYSDTCRGGAKNLFGCISLRGKQYCILNKQYSREEYYEIVARIIKQMNELPYVDVKGRIYGYGEFFPVEIGPFAYNESMAHDYFPLTQAQALELGFRWQEPFIKSHIVTKKPEDLPDHIKGVDDSIMNEIIGCLHDGKCNEQCTAAFKIIPQEIQFYRKMNLPLPRLCPNCRHHQLLKHRNPLKLWRRSCMCGGAMSEKNIYKNTVLHFHGDVRCPNGFETSYAPDRPEIVYCESCYNSEVV